MLRKTINPKFLVSLMLLTFVLLTGCQQAPSPEAKPEPTRQPSNDLMFTPAEIAVAPGSESSVSVQVTTGADLKTAAFELEQALNGVSVSFVSDADGKTGDLIIAISENLAEGTHILNVMGKSGSNTWLGKLTVTASVVAPKTYRVSASTGKDTNPGTTAAPFKTLFKALSVAKAGDTIRLRSGIYSQASNGETFTLNGAPLIVPASVMIIGELDGELNLSILQGNFGLQDTALVLDGDATVKNLHVQGFGVALLARGGKQTLSHLLLEENRIALLGVSTPTTSPVTSLTDSTILLRNISDAKGVLLGGGAKLTMTNGRMDGGNPNCTQDGFGLELRGQSEATLNGVDLENIPGITLSLTDTAKATLNTTSLPNQLFEV
jgi:endonuclease YncB( thermonuclease family)